MCKTEGSDHYIPWKDTGQLLDGFLPATSTTFQRTPSAASDLDSVSSYYMETSRATSRANSYSVR